MKKEILQKLWNNRTKQVLSLLLVFTLMYAIGHQVGKVQEAVSSISSSSVQSQGMPMASMEAMNWGLGFGEDHAVPSGTLSSEEMKEYRAYYVGDTEESTEGNTIYLTFDCGYENGNTEKILDALKKHEVSATFFIVGHFLEENEELVKRMVAEGHTIGNHTYNHPDMTMENEEGFVTELESLASAYQSVTGQEISGFYRPPQGKFTKENLMKVKEMGYRTIFWSLAYVDWYEDEQPTKVEAFDKLLPRIHPGAIVLLHNTSATNGEILDELLTQWEEMGYQVKSLSSL